MNRDEFNPQDDGAAVLDDVEALLRRFVVFPSEEDAVAVTLWTAHTHAIEVFDNTPRLAFLSPEPASGKSRALEICDLLVARPLITINASAAYLMRRIAEEEGHPPAVLYDEIDTVFGPMAYGRNEETQGHLNRGDAHDPLVTSSSSCDRAVPPPRECSLGCRSAGSAEMLDQDHCLPPPEAL